VSISSEEVQYQVCSFALASKASDIAIPSRAFAWSPRSLDLLRQLQVQRLRRDQRRPMPDDVRLFDIEPLFTCRACGRRGTDAPDFNWSKQPVEMMGRR